MGSLSAMISSDSLKRSIMSVPGVGTLSSGSQAAASRLFASRSWRAITRFCHRLMHLFTVHPAQTQETYLQHLWFTAKMSVRFAALSVILLTHGILPFTFTRTASAQIERVYGIMRSRIPKARRDAIDSEYEI